MLKNKYIFSVFIVLLSLLIYNCSEKEDPKNFSIKGHLSGLERPYFLMVTEVADSLMVDTIVVDTKGNFSYKGSIEGLTMASLYFENAPSTSIFLDQGWKIDIKGDVTRPDLILVNGGDINNDLTEFKKNNAQLFDSRAKILQEMQEKTSPEVLDSYSTDLKNINFQLTTNAREYIEANPEKIASVILIQDFYKNNKSIEALDKELSLLKGDAAIYPLTQDLRNFSRKVKQSQVGATAPNFEFYNGKDTLNLKKYRDKYLYITFASENGELYQTTLPDMINAYDTLRKKKVEFLSLLIDYENDVKPDSIKWTVHYEPRGWAADVITAYNITEIPYSILISPKGKILDRGISVIGVADKIRENEEAEKK